MKLALAILSMLCVAGAAEARKPSAPVDVTLEARAAGEGRYEVTLRAVPRVAASGLSLRLVLPAGARVVEGKDVLELGAVAAGQTMVLAATLSLPGRGATIGGGARMTYRAGTRLKEAWLRLGEPALRARKPATVVRLPSGLDVAEVRP